MAAEMGLCLKSIKRGAAGVNSGGQNQNRSLRAGETWMSIACIHVKVLERDVPLFVMYKDRTRSEPRPLRTRQLVESAFYSNTSTVQPVHSFCYH